ncbi:TPA: hypothetical protein ROQ16_000829 [Escherichia coli]|nr:hypothetical protein [Escherichia coli]
MLKKVKRRLYKEGRYSCQLPKCDTTKWSVDDWCNEQRAGKDTQRHNHNTDK